MARGRLRSASARVHGELLARLGPKRLAARMFDGDLACTVRVGRRSLPPHVVAVTAGTMA
jgi:hypothetical protein